MKKLLLAGALAVIGCQDNTAPGSTVTVTAAVSAPSLQVRTPVSITLTIYNRGSETIQLALSPCDKPFDVLNVQGQVVGPAPVEVCTLALTAPLVIEPGASAQYVTTWSGDSGFGPADEPLFVAPGTYFIRPRVRMQENTFSYGDAIAVTVTAAQ